MREGWTVSRLGDVTVPSGAIDPTKFPTRKFQYIDVSSVSNETFKIEQASEILGGDAPSRARRQIKSGDVIFATIRPTLKRIAVVPSNLDGEVCSTGYFVFRTKANLNSKFLFYYLFTDQFMKAMAALQTGASYPAVNDTQVRDQKIAFPSLAEQKRIVAILDEAFEGIDTAIVNAEKNLANARELFRCYHQSVFTQKEEGWVKKRLGDVCEFVRGPFGGSLKKSVFVSDGYAVYEQQHAIYDQFSDIRYFINENKFKEMKRFELSPDDIIMSCSGTMGRVAIVPKTIKRGIINQALLKLTPNAEMSSTFLKSWMESEAFQDALREHAGGAAIQNVASVKILKKIEVPLPSTEEQGRLITRIAAMEEETERLGSVYQQKLDNLAELKKAILQRAFAGELTEHSVEAITEAAE